MFHKLIRPFNNSLIITGSILSRVKVFFVENVVLREILFGENDVLPEKFFWKNQLDLRVKPVYGNNSQNVVVFAGKIFR